MFLRFKNNVQVSVGNSVLGLNTGNNTADIKGKMTAGKQISSLSKETWASASIFAVEVRKVTTDTLRRKLLRLKNIDPDMDDTRLFGEKFE